MINFKQATEISIENTTCLQMPENTVNNIFNASCIIFDPSIQVYINFGVIVLLSTDGIRLRNTFMGLSNMPIVFSKLKYTGRLYATGALLSQPLSYFLLR